jgi:GNAT superfamily N-acetyltransferase
MFRVRRVETGDIDGAISVLGDAFAQDPLMLYLFHESPHGARAGAMGFFSILLRARIALDMPAYVLEQGDEILGAVMGYDASRPEWPAPLAEELRRYEADTPGFAARLDAYGKLADAHQPSEGHYYLGVIGVHPSLQGKGAGKALLGAFCSPSLTDPNSRGVYLETASTASLQFYYRNGFELRGEGNLDGTPIWCVYKRT